MFRETILAAACAATLCASIVAQADTATAPDPYGPGFGFDRPEEAAATWGGWSRGDAGTSYAEWDQFAAGPGNTRAPDLGSAGTAGASLGWNAGTFIAGSGNLYNFSGVEVFTLSITPATTFDGPVSIALQTETWGTPLEFDSLGGAVSAVSLNGAQWQTKTVTYEQDGFASIFGPVLLQQVLFTWTLDAAASDYTFVLQGGPHMSFTQAAVDIGPAPVPVPGAVWLLGSALVGMAGVRRQRRAS